MKQSKTTAKLTSAPKLRFPEFREAHLWQDYRLEDLEHLGLVEIGRGEVISNQDIKAIPGDHPIYSSSVKNNGRMGSYGRFMFDEELISWSIDGGGDFFHRPRHKFSVTNVSGYMRLRSSELNYRFIASQLQALHAKQTFDYQLKAHPSVIRKLYRLAIPAFAEQEKIAECLSTLDELIGVESQKLDAFKAHKQGLMQQLFPRDGETIPRYRFPRFQNAPQWEEKPLFSVAEYENGKAYEPHIVEAGKYIVVNSRFISTDGSVRKHSNESLCIAKRGDVLMVLSDLPKGRALAKCFLADEDNVYAVNQRVCRLEARGIDSRFLCLLLNRHPNLLAYDDGINQTHLKKDAVLQCPLLMPIDTEEQARIARAFSSLSDLVASQGDKLDALKNLKKGLMQRLFPAMEPLGT